MKKAVVVMMLSVLGWGQVALAVESAIVKIETNHGDIILELDADRAPITVANFLAYVEDGFYDGTIFHRVIPRFMIQGGGHTVDMKGKPTREPIKNEAHNGLRNKRGTIAMARTYNIHSASSQFFINLEDNASLDHRNRSTQNYGYAVFGMMLSGFDVIDRIARVEVTGFESMRDVPLKPVIIKKAVILRKPGEEKGEETGKEAVNDV